MSTVVFLIIPIILILLPTVLGIIAGRKEKKELKEEQQA